MTNFTDALKTSLKKHDLFYKAICYFMIKADFSNVELQALQIRYKRYKKLLKKYKSVVQKADYPISPKEDSVNDNVWICWLQGIENAPQIVKICVESIYRNLPDKNIHIITEKNVSDYIDIPDYIVEKKEKEIIPPAHYSDIIRTLLLIKYGGLWIDATVYLTGRIPDYVFRKPLFLLHYKHRTDCAITVNSWFIYSQKENRVLKVIRDLLFAYWERENYLGEYFLWHIFANMAFEKYSSDFKELDYVSEEITYWLFYNLFNKYDPEYWQQIKRHSTVHKLSYYNFPTEDGKIPSDYSDTYYERFISGELV